MGTSLSLACRRTTRHSATATGGSAHVQTTTPPSLTSHDIRTYHCCEDEATVVVVGTTVVVDAGVFVVVDVAGGATATAVVGEVVGPSDVEDVTSGDSSVWMWSVSSPPFRPSSS